MTARICRAAAVVGVVLAVTASGGPSASPGGRPPLIDALTRAAAAARSRDPEAVQRQYELGRSLQDGLRGGVPEVACRPLYTALLRLARANVLAAEGVDRLDSEMQARGIRQIAAATAAHARVRDSCSGRFFARPRPAPAAIAVGALPPNASRPAPSGRSDAALAARLGAVAAGFSGYAGIYVRDLADGRVAAWNADSRFPAASTVKLGLLVAALARYGPRPERKPVFYDLRALAAWSSNLAANRLLRLVGGGDTVAGSRIVEERLRRLGATDSTYPGEYRVGTSRTRVPTSPPLVSQRTTTARDLGRVLVTLHDAAAGGARAQRAAGLTRHEARVGLALLLGSQRTGDNVGLFSPWLGRSVPVAQKQGWISAARHTAAIVYGPKGPVVVVLMTYREGLTLAQAQALGRKVLRAAMG